MKPINGIFRTIAFWVVVALTVYALSMAGQYVKYSLGAEKPQGNDPVDLFVKREQINLQLNKLEKEAQGLVKERAKVQEKIDKFMSERK